MGQYSKKPAKAKRARDPNRVYPNLFTHEKQLKESGLQTEDLVRRVEKQQQEINTMAKQMRRMAVTVNKLDMQLRNRNGH